MVKEIPTVKDVINKLKEYPEDTPVLVDGYEQGYDFPTIYLNTHIKEEKNSEQEMDWGGVYDDEHYEDRPKFTAVIISRFEYGNG